MKLGSLTKIDKKNMSASKKFDDDFMSFFRFMANLEQLEAASGRMVCKT